jgi:hypothetical protein
MGILMKLRIVLATSAALALAACGKSPTTTESPGTAPAADGTLSEAYLIGKWADVADGNCKLAQEFKPGGKVDGLFDSWKLAGNVLTVGMMGETQNLTVKVIDQKTMETQIAGAKPHRLRRC